MKDWLILLVCITLSSCYDNSEEYIVITTEDPPKVIIDENKITGRVLFEGVGYTDNVSVELNNVENSVGYLNFFIHNGNKIGKYNEVLKVTNSEGDAYHYAISSIENDVNYFEVSLFHKYVNGFDANTNSVWRGNQYTISYKKNNARLNNQNFADLISSKFRDFDLKDDKARVMIPNTHMGMLQDRSRGYIEMKKVFYMSNRTNDKLLLSLKNVTLDNITADEKIFFFDSKSGIWEEVSTKLVKSELEFDLEQEGFYCSGLISKGVWVEGSISGDGFPITNTKLFLQHNKGRQVAYSTANGRWISYLPANSNVSIHVEGKCLDQNSSLLVTTSANIYNHNCSLEKTHHSFISGELKDCYGRYIENGVVYFPDYDIMIAASGGKFRVPLMRCGNQAVKIILIDNNSGKNSEFSILDTQNTIDIGVWFLCQADKSNFIVLDTEGQNTYFEILFMDKTTDQRLSIYAETTDAQSIRMIIPDNARGVIDANMINMAYLGLKTSDGLYNFNCLTSTIGCGFDIVTINEAYRDKQKVVQCDFSGSFWSKSSDLPQAKNIVLKGSIFFDIN